MNKQSETFSKLNLFLQMLVPATAEDLRDGGKIVVNDEESSSPEIKYEVRLHDVTNLFIRLLFLLFI